MIAALRRRFDAARDDAGFTLIELVVTMLIVGVFMSMFTTWFTLVQRENGSQQARGNDSEYATAAMEQLGQDVRFAIGVSSNNAAFLYTSPQQSTNDSIWFYSEEGGLAAPILVHWYAKTTAAGTQLWRDSINPVGASAPHTWPTASPTTSTMYMPNIVDDNNPPIFRFLNTTNDSIGPICADYTIPPSPCATTIAAPLTATTAPTLDSVDVTFRTQTDAFAGQTTLHERLAMTNGTNAIVA